jgi:hypothetical protein
VHRRASADRQDEAQQRDEPRRGVAGKTLEQRRRQPAPVDRRHEGGRCSFQNGLAANALPHHVRQRLTVRRLTPKSSVNCRVAVASCRIAATSTTTAPSQALRPRKRNDGGVLRLRQRSTAQQKLNRWAYSSPSPPGPPRGLRRNRAECTTPPQRAHPAARAAAARSRSNARRSSWNLASASSARYKGCILPVEGETVMAKPGRNNPCPCGSGKKYKRCCLDKDVAAELEHERLAAAAWRPIVDVNIVNRFDEFDTDDAEDELTANSNAAVDLVDEGRLDEAEQVARHLLERFPDAHDGWDRLGMVYQARGDNQKAADCYRKVIEVIRAHPENYDPGFEAIFHRLVEKLNPSATA